MTITIYHNPRCTKSRQTLQLLQDNGVEPQVVEYLENPPSAKVLADGIAQFGDKFLRTGEDLYKEHFKGQNLTPEQAVALLGQYPKVMERPLVVNGAKMALGRPPESVLEIL